MQELLTVTGLILKAEPIGEYDRRVFLLYAGRSSYSLADTFISNYFEVLLSYY